MTSLLPKLPCAQRSAEPGAGVTIEPTIAGAPANPILVENAAAIRELVGELVKFTCEITIKIGRHLANTRDNVVGHGEWLAWIKGEFDWSDQTARRFIHVYELSRDAKLNTVLNLDLPLRVVYQLAAPKAEAARQEITAQIEAGEPVTEEMVIRAVTGRRKSSTDSEPNLTDSEPNLTNSEPSPTNSKDDDAASAAAGAVEVAGDAGEYDPADPTVPADPADPVESDAAASAEARKAAYAASEAAEHDDEQDPHGVDVDVLGAYDPAAARALEDAPAGPDGGEHARHGAAPGMLEETRAAPGAAPAKSDKPGTETLVEHRRRCPDELGALLDDAGLDVILGAMSPALTAALQLRARQPANLSALLDDAGLDVILGAMSPALTAALQARAKQPGNLILRLRELDLGDAASLLLGAFGWNRLEMIFGKVCELRAPKGRKAGKPFTKTLNLTAAAVASAPGEERFRQ